mmetsp:Transcript_28991/g.56755  ORF Transcript_28991/g.56755 Transcript_28991/m.56755 type:complete len:114 (-) Transcript_28991:178-519(-)
MGGQEGKSEWGETGWLVFFSVSLAESLTCLLDLDANGMRRKRNGERHACTMTSVCPYNGTMRSEAVSRLASGPSGFILMTGLGGSHNARGRRQGLYQCREGGDLRHDRSVVCL